MTPTAEQEAIIRATREAKESLLIQAYAGAAKALRNDQQVVTPNGFKPIGELTTSDMVLSNDGGAYPVLGVFPQGKKMIYSVEFSDGSSVMATGDHIWSVKRADGRWFKKTTDELRQKTRCKSGPACDWGDGTRAYWFLPMALPVNFNKPQGVMPLDPWLLGVLLGDGNISGRGILFSSADSHIIERVRYEVSKLGLDVKKITSSKYDYRITSGEKSDNPVTQSLRYLGLLKLKSDNKFIPSVYRTAHWQDRLRLLQGLMDTDGTVDKASASFTTTSSSLACGVKYLVESLGGTATMGTFETTAKLAFRLYVKLPKNLPLFSLPRKITSLKRQREPYRALMAIREIGEADATCISVGSPNHLFLTENFIPTHNTTTLVMASREIKVPALALAFNRSIKEELEKKMPSNFKVMTMNGLGFGSLMRQNPSVSFKIDDKKLGRLVTQVIKDFKTELDGEQWDCLRQLTGKAMGRGIVPSERGTGLVEDLLEEWEPLGDEAGIPSEDLGMFVDLAREVLRRDIDLALKGQVSFDDQVYVSTLISGKFPLFPVMFVDEAQDLSPLNHAMLAKCIRPDGRLIVCGDQLQSVYAFRGADHESIAKIKSLRPNWIELPLTTTFRCPKVIVKRQLWHASQFKAFETNKEGAFYKLPAHAVGLSEDGGLDFAPTWSWEDLAALRPAPEAEMAILCRNNAPLLSLAFKLLRQRVPVKFLGREIGAGLQALSKKLFADDTTPPEEMARQIREWREHETSIAVANGKEEKVDGIEDRAECLLAVLSYPTVRCAADLRRELRDLFARQDGVTLATIHKAKGLEWDMVVLLDPWRLPSKWAKQAAAKGDDRQLRQENNLKYVAETRTKNVLVWASMSDFEGLDGRQSDFVGSIEGRQTPGIGH